MIFHSNTISLHQNFPKVLYLYGTPGKAPSQGREIAERKLREYVIILFNEATVLLISRYYCLVIDPESA